MGMTKTKIEKQKELVIKLQEKFSGFADFMYGESDYVDGMMEELEALIGEIRNSYNDEFTYIEYKDRETGETHRRYFDRDDIYRLCKTAAKFYAFSDFDDTHEITEIRNHGKEIYYVGWMPGMRYIFREVDSGDVVYDVSHPEWDH